MKNIVEISDLLCIAIGWILGYFTGWLGGRKKK